MSGDPRQAHPPGTVLDEKQDVQTPQGHGVDVEEVDRQDRLRLGIQERPPGLPGPPGRGVDARLLQDLPHSRWRHLMAQADQLAVNAPVAPARIVPGHLQHQLPDGRGGTRPSRSSARASPASPVEVSVPAQQGCRAAGVVGAAVLRPQPGRDGPRGAAAPSVGGGPPR